MGNIAPLATWTGAQAVLSMFSIPTMEPVNLSISAAKTTSAAAPKETGLDYFGARYYSGAQGRFTSPDPQGAGGTAYDPQSWNMYAYGRNSPLKYTDPTGMNYTVCDSGGKNCRDLSDGQYDQYLASIQKSNVTVSGGGNINYQNSDGSVTKVGTATYYNEKLGEALQEAGNRASRDVSTSALLIGGFATSYVSTYAGPVILTGLVAMGETGAVGPGVGLLKLAQKYGLNANLPKTRQLLENLDMRVEDFVGKYRVGSIKYAEGWKFDGMTVKEALDAGGRKLLTDWRFDK